MKRVLGEVRPEAFANDVPRPFSRCAANHFAHEPTERDRVIPMRRSGCPPRRLVREHVDHRLPRERGAARWIGVKRGEAGAMREELLDAKPSFPPFAKSGQRRATGASR
jgi:hypothetical protein